VFRNLLSHLEEGTQHHLRLAVRRIMEQQTVIIAVNKRLHALEAAVENSTTKVATVESTAVASAAAVVATEKHLRSQIEESTKTVEKKLTKEVQDLQGIVNRLNGTVAGIDQRVTRLSTLQASDPQNPQRRGSSSSSST
jgi:hypothetical protein